MNGGHRAAAATFWFLLAVCVHASTQGGGEGGDIRCQLFFGRIQSQLSDCKDVLVGTPAGNFNTCPQKCQGVFKGLPPECANFVSRNLPSVKRDSPAAAQATHPIDICDRLPYCPEKAEDCRIQLDRLLRGLDLFRLPYLVGSSGLEITTGSDVNVGAIVAGVVVGNAALVAAVAGIMWFKKRHSRRREMLAQAGHHPPATGSPSAVAGSSSSTIQTGKLDAVLDSAECGEGVGHAISKPREGTGLPIAAAAGPAAPYAASDGGTTASSSRIPVGTPPSPFDTRGVASLWAHAAAQGAAASWAAHASASPSPLVSSATTTLIDQMQQDELEMMRLGAAGESAAAQAGHGSVVVRDPLLSWVDSQLQPDAEGQLHLHPVHPQQPHPAGLETVQEDSSGTLTPSASATSSQRRSSGWMGLESQRTSGLVDLKPWQLKYSDLRIQRPLGEGSYGKVFLATWNETLVAVKLLLSTDDAATVTKSSSGSLSLLLPVFEELQKEAGVMASLRHPNVVLFLGVCSTPPAVVTEYCSRGSLLDVLRSASASEQLAQQLTWVRRLSMALDAAKGMLCLHAHNPPIIHRDLKSPNLLVDAAWRVKVCDFNLSKIMEDSARSSSAGGLLNPRWLAPEVLMGQGATSASDVFSFGTVLWELLTWQLPWEGVNLYQLVFMVSRGERLSIPPPDRLPGPEQLSEYEAYVSLIRRCWAQQPAERPSFAEAISELRGILSRTVGNASASV